MSDNLKSVIVCIGSPLLDIITQVDQEFLKIHNLEANSAKFNNSDSFFKSILKLEHQSEIGGSVTNTARILQAILEEKNAVAYLGAIGKDTDGEIIKKRLQEEGVLCIFKEYDNIHTGRCAVLISNENRSLCTDLGASRMYTQTDLSDIRAQESLKTAKYVYFSAFLLGVSSDCVAEIVKLRQKTIAFNIGAAFLCEKYPKEFLKILEYTDIVFGNDDEARALVKIIIGNTSDKNIKTVCSAIQMFKNCKSEERIVVITRGAKSLIVASKDGVREYHVIAVEKDKIKDTNGAGDAFAGGFLAQLIQGLSVEESLKCGIMAAQEIIKNVGFCFDKKRLQDSCFQLNKK